MKTDSITKEQLGWLAVRAAGIYFACLAFSRIAAFFYAAYLLTNEGWQDIRETVGGSLSWELAWPKAAQFIFYTAIALYLLRGGGLIHRILTSGPRPQDTLQKVAAPGSEAHEAKTESVQPTTP